MTDFFKIINDFKISAEERLDAAAKIAKNFKQDLDAVCEVDLHCHSFYSDGYFSPTAKVFEAFRRKMKAIAIADHDVFDGQIEALRAGEIFGIDVIAAAEFYTNRPGIEIIAHFPDKDDFIRRFKTGIFDSVVKPIKKAKKKQLEGMIARIPDCFAKFAFNAKIKEEDIDRYVRNGISTKGDISVIMWQKYGQELRKRGIADDVKDFQARYTTNLQMLDLPLEIELDLSPDAFVKRILNWGGLPGLSHPTELRRKEGLNNQALIEVIEKL
ncbi:MAG TPA: PHP domain-containing protein, partial [Victivallales bacterium]|nr:PHP domain-containing protein [Victivallales bacterium]